MQVALEPDLRRELHVLAAQSDSSIKDWIIDRLASRERRQSLGGYLIERMGQAIVLAPPSNADRFNIKLDHPQLDTSLDELAEGLQRTRPQVLYTLLVCLVDEHKEGLDVAPQRLRSA